MKSSLNGIKSRLNTAKENINGLEDITVETILMKYKKKKKIRQNKIPIPQ